MWRIFSWIFLARAMICCKKNVVTPILRVFWWTWKGASGIPLEIPRLLGGLLLLLAGIFFLCVWRSLKWSYRFSLSLCSPPPVSFARTVRSAASLHGQLDLAKPPPLPLVANSLAILMAADRTSPFLLLLLGHLGCSANCNYFFFSAGCFFVSKCVVAFLLAQ